MRVFYGRVVITTGRGRDRQEVCLARNIEAEDRADAISRLGIWALQDVLRDRFAGLPDTRTTFSVTLGASCAPSAIG